MPLNQLEKGNLLIARPTILGDFTFNRSVILLADHSEDGSVGFIINKSLDFNLSDIFPDIIHRNFHIFNGGPVEQDKLFFIHSIPKKIPGSIKIVRDIYWGGDFDTVKELLKKDEIAENEIKFFLGYAGWQVHQLEDELNSASWAMLKNKKKEIFEDNTGLWKQKMKELGGEYLIWSNAPENPSYN